jgi:hypothetical protein
MAVHCSIAYLILTHDDPVHLRRLIKRLEHRTAAFYVHVDAKAELDSFRRATADINAVYFCEPRVNVTWAAFSVVEATLCLLETALAHNNCVRFVLLSGSDYPIASSHHIVEFFARYPFREFIRGFDIRGAGNGQLWRIRGWHFREAAPRHSVLRPALFVLERGLRLLPRHLPAEITFVCGSQWWALTRECAQFCLDFARANRDLVRVFKMMFAPDEIFFHTIIHNSAYAPEADALEAFDGDVLVSGSLRPYSNLHYLSTGWIRTPDEARKAMGNDRGRLFARKFSTKHSVQAMEFIDKTIEVVHGNALPASCGVFDPKRLSRL